MDRIKDLLSNKELEAKLNGCIDAGKIKKLAKEYGTDLTDEEAQKAVGMLRIRLADEDLEKVAGGSIRDFEWDLSKRTE